MRHQETLGSLGEQRQEREVARGTSWWWEWAQGPQGDPWRNLPREQPRFNVPTSQSPSLPGVRAPLSGVWTRVAAADEL